MLFRSLLRADNHHQSNMNRSELLLFFKLWSVRVEVNVGSCCLVISSCGLLWFIVYFLQHVVRLVTCSISACVWIKKYVLTAYYIYSKNVFLCFYRFKMVIGKVCDEFHSSSISYPPTSLLELLKIFRNLKINALHIYVSYIVGVLLEV